MEVPSWWKATFYERQPRIEDELQWKTMNKKCILMEDSLCFKTTFKREWALPCIMIAVFLLGDPTKIACLFISSWFLYVLVPLFFSYKKVRIWLYASDLWKQVVYWWSCVLRILFVLVTCSLPYQLFLINIY